MPTTKKYFKSPEELENKQEFIDQQKNEFVEELPIDKFLGDSGLATSSTSRRDFLKFLGFGVGAATLAACEGPVHKAIPYLNKPEEITPGEANWYASTYINGTDYCPVLVKTREGRPIHIEGNKMSPVTNGAVNARVQASVLSLYDSGRLKGPMANGAESTWAEVDKEIGSKLNAIRENGGSVRVLSSSVGSPTTKRAIHEFLASFNIPKEEDSEEGSVSVDAVHVVYDAVSYSGIRKANELSFGKAVVPNYRFDKAKAIVSVGADFLGNWVAPIEFSHQYGIARRVDKGNLAKHIQFESNLSLSGSNADDRYPVKPSQYGAVLTGIYNEIAKLMGRPPVPSRQLGGEMMSSVMAAANHLLKNKGAAILISGSNNPNHQVVANSINELIGSYGNTIDLNNPRLNIQSDDTAVSKLIKEMNAGSISALIIYGTNPSYSLPNSLEFNSGLGKVGLTISFADRMDETGGLVDYVCPDHHYLESWNDASSIAGEYSLCQPTIKPLFKTRQAQESLINWAGNKSNYLTFLKKSWEETVFPDQSKHVFFDSFWNQSLHDGVITVSSKNADAPDAEVNEEEAEEVMSNPVMEAASNLSESENGEGKWELSLYEKIGIGNGEHANNPWLQELPDPVSKVCWDNYITMNPSQMKELNFNTTLGQVQEADVVEISINGTTIKAPVYPQYGQAKGTIGLAVGYGRTGSGKTGDGVGVNAYPLATFNNGNISFEPGSVEMSGSVGGYHIATIQTHHTMMGRDPVRETTLEEFETDPKSGNPETKIMTTDHLLKSPEEVNLWQSFPKEGHFWNLSIDLTACIGCGACVVSCTSENNVPVVGKDEVRRSREMHWIRIDRYYSSDEEQKPENDRDLDEMEVPSSSGSLSVVFQPLMCQHCNHAPCETVCPVAATTHSNDGLNQMIYNRCVGTKFCLNNCPYKVRRFNWFNYKDDNKFADVNPSQDDWGRMVLNPDVVVRSRGVMEKCSMCIQRIQAGKLTAKKDRRKLVDGDIQTACAAACPTHAIKFGDVNDETSEMAELKENPRAYYLLDELNTQPSVRYLTKVRNKNKA